jgi:myosin heavy subunit
MPVPLKLEEARDTRHALGKFVYGNLFSWLVQKVTLL